MDTAIENKNLDMIMDVRVEVSVQLGTAELPMKEVLELSEGSVIQLRQEAKDRPVP